MTNCDDIDEVNERDSAYATTTATEDIQYIDTTTEWSNWRDELAEAMFTEWQLRFDQVTLPNWYALHNLFDDAKCIIVEKKLFDNWATGRFTETFADMGSNKPARYDGFDMSNGNEEFPSVYIQGIHMSQENNVRASRPSRAYEGRAGSSGLKRKRRSQQCQD
ncbi:retrotransposon protein [Cucumis melo var. makuwa]|uniref:Retrotransposon protein n=1 Tax=Cucumis melo var. makuwa TaxID=1194695 RepID=A0A5A7TYT9_CUCMM|nr:retrotransposon protein [Cucumis melo var. makuwa]